MPRRRTERIGSCVIEHTPLGFHVTRDGEPVPPRAHPPALLFFKNRVYARQFATAIDADDTTTAHRLIEERGEWW